MNLAEARVVVAEARVTIIPQADAAAAVARARQQWPGEWRAEAMEMVMLPALRRRLKRRYGIVVKRVGKGYAVTAKGVPWNVGDPSPGLAWNAYQRKTTRDLLRAVDALRAWARVRTKSEADAAINPAASNLNAVGIWIDNAEYLALPESVRPACHPKHLPGYPAVSKAERKRGHK